MTSGEMKPVRLTDAGMIDLDSHAVIEASAGTGKTYTIEQIVVRLLMSGRISSLDQVLVVTFTEKATGEIRSRIRALLQKNKSSAAPAEARRLGDALDSFDSASIFTIHGFCNRVLQLYPFEYGGHFSFSLADDGPVNEAVLRERIRSSWRAEYGDRLEDILRLSGFPGEKTGESWWMKRVLKVAANYCPEAGDVLVPQPDDNLAATIASLPERCRKTLSELDRLAGEIDPSDLNKSSIVERYNGLNCNKTKKRVLTRDILIPLVELIALHREKKADAFTLLEFRNNREAGGEGFGELMKYWNKPGPDYEEKFPELPDIVRLAGELVSLIPQNLDMQLAAISVARVIDDASRYKAERALVSYRDMIALVERAARDSDGPLCGELRKKYRYAVVDEFQDTDMLQWSLFKNIFLTGGTSRLIVVGDPKQAIYGFRGADVYAYHEAKKEMTGMGARFYWLADNWRSTELLIGQYNLLFGGNSWFTDPDVAYNDVLYPQKRAGAAIPAGAAGLTVADMGNRTGAEARARYARFVAREISRLVNEHGVLPRDMAVLIRKWNESPIIEDELRRAGVRFSYYKREGLYQSREAYQVRCLLGAAADPGDYAAVKRVLLTVFFGLSPQDLTAYEAAAESHPASALLSRWNALAGAGRWAEMFDSVLRDSGVAPRALDREDGERSLADIRHIMEEVSARACSGRTDMRGLIKFLDGLISGGAQAGDTSNYHRPERDDPGVQIMTVHASKGLQFSVVFVAGGFTESKPDDVMVYHDRGRRCFNLAREKNSAASELFDREQLWEEQRLFYVALTRAAGSLYVPYFRYSRASGPLGRWVADSLEKCRGKQSIRWIDAAAGASAEPRAAEFPVKPGGDAATLSRCAGALLDFTCASFIGRRNTIDSFSSIKSREAGEHGDERAGFGDSTVKEYDEAVDQAGAVADDSLPGGAYIGTVFHEVLERVDFSSAADAKDPGAIPGNGGIMDLVTAALDRNLPAHMRHDSEGMAPEIIRMIRNTLTADISGAGLVLGRLSNRVHEVEFLVSSPSCPAGVPGISACGEFITGFIDLVFEHEGKYYLLDWKSNHLPGGYGPESLARCMEESRYVLQYRIYAAALLRMLKQRLDGFDYERHFGGIYYVFMRGVDPSRPGSGIYFYRPSGEAEIAGYEQEFFRG